MARVLDSVTMPVKKNGTTTPQEYINNPKSTAPQFSALVAYAAGQIVFYEKKLYRFKTAHPAGAWNAAHVEEITVASELNAYGEELTELKADFTQLDGKIAASLITNTASGAIVSIPDGADGVPVKDLTVQIVPVQSGSGYPAPDNVRPISGWTGANVVRTGKNLLNKSAYSDISGSHIRWGGLFQSNPNGSLIIPAGTYTVSASDAATGWYIYAQDGTSLKTVYNNTKATFTVPYKQAIIIDFYRSGVTQADLEGYTYQLEQGETATDYEPFGNAYSIDWTTEAGTVYGGTLDVTTGVLTVDRYYVTLDNSPNVSYHTGSIPSMWFRYENGKSANASTSNAKSNMYKVGGGVAPYVAFYGSEVDIYDARFTDEETAREILADFICVYKLAEPQTYQLTPQEVSTLLGQNNIWADTGDVSVDYRADTKLYIEKLTAPTEDDMVANTNIPDATYFMVGNNLYLSTTTIPAGDTINPGTNCTKMDLAAALNAINS